ncbi:MAG: tetratricopeptide repeat protein [Phycisphaerales bacterium]
MPYYNSGYHRSYWPGAIYGSGYGIDYGYPGYWYDRYDYPPSYVIGYGYSDPFLQSGSAYTPPQATPAQPERELTPLEKADLALRDGDAEVAVTLYRDYLTKSPEDAQAARSLALALIQTRDIKEAVAVMQFVYDKHPSLASKPVLPAEVEDGARGLRRMLRAVVPFANRTRSASGYLTEVVIMQAEGRQADARRILRKAIDAGLQETIAKEFETALNP